jgi:DNA-binding CsgD family transcriptional regulator
MFRQKLPHTLGDMTTTSNGAGPAANGWERLTPTELKVVGHAAAGLTNPEIGERMSIARGTVKVHLSNVYAKLGVKNRTQLASEAARRLLAELTL